MLNMFKLTVVGVTGYLEFVAATISVETMPQQSEKDIVTNLLQSLEGKIVLHRRVKNIHLLIS